MKKMRFLSVAIFFFCLLSCSKEELNPYEQSILGSWRLYGMEGSTGYQWYVIHVPADSMQTLTFLRGGTLRAKGRMVNTFNFPKYKVFMEDDRLKLKVFGRENHMLGFDSILRIERDTMHISPSCREGCLYSFVKIK